jgi:hypothetical protein
MERTLIHLNFPNIMTLGGMTFLVLFGTALVVQLVLSRNAAPAQSSTAGGY